MKTSSVSRQHAVLACLLALALAFGLCPTLAFAESVPPASSSAENATAASGDEAAESVANLAVYGPDGSQTSAWLPLTEWSFEEDATAADMTRALFEANGIVADIQETSYGLYLNSITSADGTVYAFDEETGAYWGLYVNGVSASVGMSSLELEPGDTVVWYYGPYAEILPNLAPDGFAPDAPLSPSEDVAWGSFGGNANGVVEGTLPLGEASADLAWSESLLQSEGNYANVSNLLVVDGLVYVAESDSVWTSSGSSVSKAVLRAYDAQTGEVEKTWTLPYSIDSTCRMAYADGVIAVPVAGGGLLGVNADTLQPRWYVASNLDASAQSLNSVTVHDGYFVHASAVIGGEGWSATDSEMLCVNVQTGAAKWRYAAETGSYWSGAAVVNGVVLIGTDAGTLRALDFETGELISESTVAESARVRSEIVAISDAEAVFSTTAGNLVKVSVSTEGAVTETGRVNFAGSSTGTPAISDGVAVVGGSGVLAEVDLATMTIAAKHTAAGDVQSAPVVATGADGLRYAYFTCNMNPGALYGVRLGDGAPEAFAVYTPAEEDQDYCMASPSADGEGRVFYTNDSGALFAVEHDATCGFSDVAETDWVVSEGWLERVVTSGLMGQGVVDFCPWDDITRGEAVTVLYRAAGEPEPGVAYPFVDVYEDDFYHDAVLWARAEGIVTGYEDGSNMFGPDDAITREQLAKMLAEYARYVGGVSVENADPAAFEALAGSEQADDWAREGLVWCCANGILTGDLSTGTPQLNPLGGADRAMMAKMIVLTQEAIF